MVENFLIDRNYKAPELLLEYRKYGKAVDLWSFGVIFAGLVGNGEW
jgi:serine/threonine protein kinase